jgi:mono/diheme cytochrome c family protein
MKVLSILFTSFIIILVYACGGNATTESTGEKPKSMLAEEEDPLKNKGVGPIKEVVLSPTVDEALAAQGEEVYKKMCTACHKPTEKFIGPAPVGILERRSPEWIMNMILNPEKMVTDDPIAKQLLVEFNGSPMANQHLTEEQARAVLEYFRTLK